MDIMDKEEKMLAAYSWFSNEKKIEHVIELMRYFNQEMTLEEILNELRCEKNRIENVIKNG